MQSFGCIIHKNDIELKHSLKHNFLFLTAQSGLKWIFPPFLPFLIQWLTWTSPQMNINSKVVLWIRDIPRVWPQHVSVNGHMSKKRVLNSGVSQSWVLSLTLLLICTDHMRCKENAVTCLFKDASDLVLVWPSLGPHALLNTMNKEPVELVWRFQYLDNDLSIQFH